jgi:tetratricopeptide (TPR) repeat protein
MRECLRFAIICILTMRILIAQDPGGRNGVPVRGEISPLPPGSGTLTVELSPNGGGLSESAAVHPDGTFELRSAHPGVNTLRVVAAGGAIVYEETLTISDSRQELSIRLPESSSANRLSDGTVSIRQLTHKVPPQARKAFENGQRARNKGNTEQAAGLFREAVSIDPEFADAFNELGALDVARGNLEQAIEDYQKAIDAVPDHRLALSNLSIVLAKLHRFDEAATVARRALQFAPGSGTLRYILATSLLFVKGDSDEVLDNLNRSANEVPMAHLVAAELLVRRGQRAEAIHHIEDYLVSAPSDDKHRDRAQALLAELRQ